MFFDRLFGKKEMDRGAAEAFWAYFVQRQEGILDVLKGSDGQRKQVLILLLDEKICPVFPYERPQNVQFELGSNAGVNELRFFHCGKAALKRDMQALADMAPEEIRRSWTITVDK